VNDPQEELLGLLADELREGGVPAIVMPADGAMPAQMVTSIESTDEQHHLRVHSYFLPDADAPAVLQHFVTLPYDITVAALPTAARFICALNAELPVTGFELGERSRAVVFRHTHAVNIRPLDPGVVAWTLAMVSSAVTELGDLVEAAGGGADLDELTTRLQDRLAAVASG